MKPKLLLTLAAMFWAIPGIIGLVVPNMAVNDPNASAALSASIRSSAALYIALAVLDWLARDVEASKARNAIFVANVVGYGLSGIFLVVVALMPGASPSGWVIAGITLFFAAAFILVGRANMSTSAA